MVVSICVITLYFYYQSIICQFFSLISFIGIEAKATVSSTEEAAFLHWERDPGSKGLPARWCQLVGTLLVQVPEPIHIYISQYLQCKHVYISVFTVYIL